MVWSHGDPARVHMVVLSPHPSPSGLGAGLPLHSRGLQGQLRQRTCIPGALRADMDAEAVAGGQQLQAGQPGTLCVCASACARTLACVCVCVCARACVCACIGPGRRILCCILHACSTRWQPQCGLWPGMREEDGHAALRHGRRRYTETCSSLATGSDLPPPKGALLVTVVGGKGSLAVPRQGCSAKGVLLTSAHPLVASSSSVGWAALRHSPQGMRDRQAQPSACMGIPQARPLGREDSSLAIPTHPFAVPKQPSAVLRQTSCRAQPPILYGTASFCYAQGALCNAQVSFCRAQATHCLDMHEPPRP